MTTKQKNKLRDYISGLEELKKPSSFSIGAVIIDEKNRNDILKIAKKEKISILKPEKFHPDITLENLIKIIEKGKIAILDIQKELPQKIINSLSNLIAGYLNVRLAGEKEPLILNPLPKGGKVVFLMNKGFYSDLALQDMISSVCRV